MCFINILISKVVGMYKLEGQRSGCSDMPTPDDLQPVCIYHVLGFSRASLHKNRWSIDRTERVQFRFICSSVCSRFIAEE